MYAQVRHYMAALNILFNIRRKQKQLRREYPAGNIAAEKVVKTSENKEVLEKPPSAACGGGALLKPL